MNLDHCAVVVRERNLPEIYDLAFALLRRQGVQVALLTAVAAVPFLLLDLLLLHGSSGPWAFYAAWLLLCAQTPIATAPATAWMGQAMFDRHPRRRDALRTAYGRLGPILLAGLARGLLALPVITVLFYPPHLVEVLLLERQPLRAAWSRAQALGVSGRGIGFAHLLVALVVMAAGTLAAWLAGSEVVDMLAHGRTGEALQRWWMEPLEDPVPLIVVAWPLVGFLSVVRFLAYLDLRTRSEGWDVELDLLRAARRMIPETA
jgi:hypothetical protein